MPDEVRKEVGLLLADLIVRLKQLLFNSILCAYYVGFIPVQFADVSACDRMHNCVGWVTERSLQKCWDTVMIE